MSRVFTYSICSIFILPYLLMMFSPQTIEPVFDFFSKGYRTESLYFIVLAILLGFPSFQLYKTLSKEIASKQIYKFALLFNWIAFVLAAFYFFTVQEMMYSLMLASTLPIFITIKEHQHLKTNQN
ncbi:hypothetical protein [Thalassotalea crassostreae]|uniref:hypothetical protein n=1 Tax=Thalassotalea crassostreae TaxID=1763536 RepID=UPI000838BCED|nr:hypothetical protein [Thalassotalea crassostreae]